MKARVAYFNCYQIFHVLTHSVVSPYHIDADPDADPDSAYHPDADPDSDFYLSQSQSPLRHRDFYFSYLFYNYPRNYYPGSGSVPRSKEIDLNK